MRQVLDGNSEHAQILRHPGERDLVLEPGAEPQYDLIRIDQALGIRDDGMFRTTFDAYTSLAWASWRAVNVVPERETSSTPALDIAQLAKRARGEVVVDANDVASAIVSTLR